MIKLNGLFLSLGFIVKNPFLRMGDHETKKIRKYCGSKKSIV